MRQPLSSLYDISLLLLLLYYMIYHYYYYYYIIMIYHFQRCRGTPPQHVCAHVSAHAPKYALRVVIVTACIVMANAGVS